MDCAAAGDGGDHPRACGENTHYLQSQFPCRGSPPRMRGKHHAGVHQFDIPGITPAHAGKTPCRSKSSCAARDHPRACGENAGRSFKDAQAEGSPPRMRGKRMVVRDDQQRRGITPAHAGKTLRKGRISVVDPSPQPRSSLTSRRADASIGSQRAPCAAPV